MICVLCSKNSADNYCISEIKHECQSTDSSHKKSSKLQLSLKNVESHDLANFAI